MFRAITSIFRKVAAKSPEAERDVFLRKLGELDVLIIAAMQSDGIDPKDMTKEQLLEEIRRATEDMGSRESFAPLIYESEGQRRLPFFTNADRVEQFIGAYSKKRQRVFPFQVLTVKGTLLGRLIPACDVLVMDDQTADELVFSDDDMAACQRLWG